MRCQPHIQVLLGFLAVGDLCICLEEIGDSSLRLLAMLQTREGKLYFHNEKVPRIMCLWSLTSHMGFIQTALQQPATVAIALERCFAVFKPLLYNAEWKSRYERRFIAALLLYAGAIVSVNYISFIVEPDYLINVKCSDSAEWINLYNDYEKGIWSCVAAFLTVVAVVKGRSFLTSFSSKNPELAVRMKRLNRTAAIIVMTNFVLVIGPALLRMRPGNTSAEKSAIYCLVLSNSIANLPVLLMTNSDFRKKALNAIMGVVKGKGNVRVGTTSVPTVPNP